MAKFDKVTLASICDGAAAEVFQRELKDVLENINDASTYAEQARKITLTFAFKPTADRSAAAVSFSCQSKLVPVESVKRTIIMSRQSGQLEAYASAAHQEPLFEARARRTLRMLKEAIEKILGLAPVEVKLIEGRTYSDRQLYPQLEPVVPTVEVATLTGLVALFKEGVNGLEDLATYVRVASPLEVVVENTDPDTWGRRERHISAETSGAMQKFPFGTYLDQETFIIALSSRVLESPQRDEMLAQVSRVTAENVTVAEDDGISQQVSVRAGVALKEHEKVKRIVNLRPYRTFREVEQPESAFVFRVKVMNGKVYCALFEADGGTWELVAVHTIATWLRKELPAPVVVVA